MKKDFTVKLRLGLLALSGLLISTASQAGILSFFGWGYSDNETYKTVESYVSATGEVLGAVGIVAPPAATAGAVIKGLVVVSKVIDPSSFNSIESGRITINFDPSYQVLAAGWFGEFGADPLKVAPAIPVPTDDSGIGLLQLEHNASMASASIIQSPGQVVFNFDWGSPGLVPSSNLYDDHFNLAGLYLYSPTFAEQTTGTTADVALISGSPSETAALGTASSTFMLCDSGFCGVNPVSEPDTYALMLVGLGLMVPLYRRRKPRKTAI